MNFRNNIINMDERMLKMCRCCLVMDVKMYFMKTNEILDLITKQKMSAGWVCYLCKEFLRKISSFRDVCLSSEVWLLQLYDKGALSASSLDNDDEQRRIELRNSLIKTICNPSPSNTLAISVLTEQHIVNNMSPDSGYDSSRTNVWSFLSKEDAVLQRNFCQGMEEVDGSDKDKIRDIVLPFVKVECGDEDRIVFPGEDNSIKNSIDDGDYFNNDILDHGSDSDDENYNVPLINVAMMAASNTSNKQLKDEKANDDIKMEDEINNDMGEEVKFPCKYCWESFSKASYLPGHYRTCKERKSKRAAAKRGSSRRQIQEVGGAGELQSVGVIKMEPVDVEDMGETLLNDVITSEDAALKVKKKKKKNFNKEKSRVGDELYSCETCPKTFLKQSQLNRHTRIHSGERPFKCDFEECTYSSSRTDDLKKHKRKHTGDRPYSCTVEGCHFTYSYHHHLNRHMRTHSGAKEYMCDTCGKKFTESNGLKQHQLSAHTELKPYTCEECDYSTSYPNLLKDHQDKAHGTSGKNYVCDECGHSYWRADQLKVHKRVHSGEKPFKCDICSFATSHSNALKVHKRSHSNERPYVCEECAHAFARKDDLKTHMRIHSGDRPYACDRCPYTAAQKSNLKRHKISHLGIKPFCCDECGKRFAEASSLKMHKRLHTGVRPFKCPHCPYSTSQSGGLKRHLVSHSGEKPFVCHVCGKAFTLIYDLNNHSRIHTGEKPYSCDVCSFATSHHNALKIHKRSHTGEKPFRCDVCAQCFSRGGDLKTHKRIHTGEKPYACTVCCYTATQASNLKRHMVSHSGKKPFTCGDCGKAFTEAGTLRIHRRTHTGERPYCCHHCAQAFSQAGHLRKHMRLHANNSSNSGTASAVAAANNANTDATPGILQPNNNAISNTNTILISNVFKTEINPLSSGTGGTNTSVTSLINTNTSHINITGGDILNSNNSINSSNLLNNHHITTDLNNINNGRRVASRDSNELNSVSDSDGRGDLISSIKSGVTQDVDDDKSNIILQLTIHPNDTAAC